MSSDTAMNKYHGGVASYRSSEGKTVKVPFKGPVQDTINNILGGLGYDNQKSLLYVLLLFTTALLSLPVQGLIRCRRLVRLFLSIRLSLISGSPEVGPLEFLLVSASCTFPFLRIPRFGTS